MTPNSKDRMQRSFHKQNKPSLEDSQHSLSGSKLKPSGLNTLKAVGVDATQGKDAFLAVSEEASTIQRQVTNEAAVTNIENLRSELMR